MTLNLELHPIQGKAFELLSRDDIEVLGFGGSKGSSKSHTGRVWMIARMLQNHNSKGLILRNTFPELERTHINRIKKDFAGVYDKYNEQKHTFTFSNGSILELGYIDSEKDLQTYFSSEYDSIFLDEAQFHSVEVFQGLRTILRTTRSDRKCKFLLTWNWGNKGHSWLKRKFWDKIYDRNEDPSKYHFLRARVYDNPSILQGDPDYVKRLESLPDNLKKLYLDGDPTGAEGQFFSEFSTALSEELFLVPYNNREGRLYGSIDSGTTHSTSFGLSYIDSNNVIHRLLTYNAVGRTIQEHAQSIYDVIETCPMTGGYFPDKIYADPSMWTQTKLNSSSIRSPIDEYIDLWKSRGKKSDFVKANNERANGCHIMRTLFKNGKFRYIDKYNGSMVTAIQSAMFDKNNTEMYMKTPTDDDDILDELRYSLVAGYSMINNIKDKKQPETRLSMLLKGKLGTRSNDFYNTDLRRI